MKNCFKPVSLAALVLALEITLGASPAHGQRPQTRPTAVPNASTVVLVVRHAEKASETARDPELSAAGMARAEALLEVARDAGVTAILATQFLRTQATAAPVAAARGLTPEIVPAVAAVDAHARTVAEAARRHAGGVVLIVGHSNTVPAIVAALGVPEPPPICDDEYDNLYVVVLGSGSQSKLVHSRYGAPSVATAGCGAMLPR